MSVYVHYCPKCGYVASDQDERPFSCVPCNEREPDAHHGLKTHDPANGPLLTVEQTKEMLAQLSRYYGEPVMPMSRYCRAFERWLGAIATLNARPPRDENDKPEYRHGHRWAPFVRDIRLAISKSSLLGRLLYEGEEFRTVECPEHKGKWSGLEFPESPCPHGCNMTGWLPQPNDPLHLARKRAKEELESYPILLEEDAKKRAAELLKSDAPTQESAKLLGLHIGSRTSTPDGIVRGIFFRDTRMPYGLRLLRGFAIKE